MIIAARFSTTSNSLPGLTFESEVILLRNTENRRTKNVPSGDGKTGGSPLPLHLHGVSPTGIQAIGGPINTDGGK